MAEFKKSILNKSLNRSLTLLTKLLTASIDTPMTQIVFFHDGTPQVFANRQAEEHQLNLDEVFLRECLNKKEVFITESPVFKENNKEIKFYASAPLITIKGNTIGLLIIFDTKKRSITSREITLLKDFAETTTNSLEKHLENEKIQQTFTDLLHKTVHDLKNPLTSISLTSELLKRKADDPKTVINFAERLDKANHKLFSNLDKLKSTFPIANNYGFKLDISEIKLSSLLSDIKGDFEKIDIIIENESEINIHIDYSRLKEAITELIKHATLDHSYTSVDIKSYTKDKELIIEISAEDNNKEESAALMISRTLIEMHKGKIETNHNSYYICLPFNTP